MKSCLDLLFSYINRIQIKSCFVVTYSTILLLLIANLALPTLAFEDYIITTKGKLTDISIEDNTIVDIYPLITIMNDKNTLMVSPLKTGKTRFCVLKNNKEKIMFQIEVLKNKTIIQEVKGFEILSLDKPIEEIEIDKPPLLKEVE